MRIAVEHVIGHHRCRRVAFIGGPDGNVDADVRLRAYYQALIEHGIE